MCLALSGKHYDNMYNGLLSRQIKILHTIYKLEIYIHTTQKSQMHKYIFINNNMFQESLVEKSNKRVLKILYKKYKFS